MENVLEVHSLNKIYGGRSNSTRALNDVSFTVQKGEFVGVMGASGSGKTTLLNCVATIDSPTSGQVLVSGKDVTRMRPAELARFRREELGFVFQDFNLLDTLTAYENIALALTIMGEKPKAILQHVKLVAETLDITDVLKKYPYEMSGGQKQRVACARAIIHNPKLILADEPTGALDSRAARLLLQSFERLNSNLGATIMMVTHDAFTASYCKRILFIKDGRVFNELIRGEMDRKTFFERIIEVVTLLGGDMSNVL